MEEKTTARSARIKLEGAVTALADRAFEKVAYNAIRIADLEAKTKKWLLPRIEKSLQKCSLRRPPIWARSRPE